MGKMFPAIKVFSMCIAALVDDMVNAGGKRVAGGLVKSDVHWVLTVPAIWSDAAKQFMREAAEMEPVGIGFYSIKVKFIIACNLIFYSNSDIHVLVLDKLLLIRSKTIFFVIDQF